MSPTPYRPDNVWPEEDELPTWKALSKGPVRKSSSAGHQRHPDQPGRAPEKDPVGPTNLADAAPPTLALLIASGALVIGAILGGALVLSGSEDSNPEGEAASTTSLATTPQETVASIAGSVVPNTLAFADPDPEEGVVADPQQDPEPAEISPTSESGAEPDRLAVFSNGMIYLRGRVPSQEIGDAIAQRAGAVIGPDNVVNEYTIDPTVQFDPDVGAPLYVEDLVLFQSGSTRIAPQFIPLLDLGIMLMSQNPQVTVTVIGHTDAKGSEADNLALSQARVQSVLDYWILAGVDPSRVTVIGEGEATPLADNTTSEGRRINRRVEFIITGILA